MDSSSTAPEAGTPGTENAPGGGGSTDGAHRAAPGAPPAASNQPKTENLQTAPEVTGAPGTVGSADPQSPTAGGRLSAAGSPEAVDVGEEQQLERSGGFAAFPAPAGALADDDRAGAARTAPGSPPASVQSVPTPGDPAGVGVPSVLSAAGSSEDSDAVSGVRATSSAPPGKPDGEVDTSR